MLIAASSKGTVVKADSLKRLTRSKETRRLGHGSATMAALTSARTFTILSSPPREVRLQLLLTERLPRFTRSSSGALRRVRACGISVLTRFKSAGLALQMGYWGG